MTKQRELNAGEAIEAYEAGRLHELSPRWIETLKKTARIGEELRQIGSRIVPSPTMRGLLRLLEILRSAEAEDVIRAAPKVHGLVNEFLKVLEDSKASQSTEQMLGPILKKGVSTRQRNAARAKNADMRAWVQMAWRERLDQNQTKAAFSRVYAALLKKKHQEKSSHPTARTIETAWLKGM